MKKALTVFFTLALIMSIALLPVSAEKTAKEEYQVPKAQTAPVIDGVMSKGEWDNCFTKVLSEENCTVKGNFEGATINWMWDDKGLYLFAKVNDTHPIDPLPAAPKDKQDCVYLADKDCVMLMIYTNPEANDYSSCSNAGVLYFCLTPRCADGKAYATEFHSLATIKEGKPTVKGYYPIEGMKIASTYNDAGYSLEVFFPAELFVRGSNKLEIKSGAKVPMTNIISYAEGSAKAQNAMDAASYNASEANFYNLVNTPAGKASSGDSPNTGRTVIGVAVLSAAALAGAAAALKKIRR